MRSATAPSAFTGTRSSKIPASRQTVPPPAAFTWSTAAWIVSGAVRVGGDADGAVAVLAVADRRPQSPAVALPRRERDGAEARVVMLDPERRSRVELLDRGVGRPGGEDPVVARTELTTAPGRNR